MAIRVEHELHTRRKGRNYGVGLLLAGVIAIVFGLTVVKALNLGDIRQMEGFDHTSRPGMITEGEGQSQ
ncbi:MAG: putative cox locus protein [uncultured Rubellimicrobium sp.]|uniref:Putative cox locus protein n=1 Tax=uncultured Rubellimicrobium sp. TaxID=543078 RepID=A0A6J4Q8H1_9RHOB|nr:MAG: putative cox locus protein [uncultured Rubellimicrobium sp.]